MVRDRRDFFQNGDRRGSIRESDLGYCCARRGRPSAENTILASFDLGEECISFALIDDLIDDS